MNGYPEFPDPYGLLARIPTWKKYTQIIQPSPAQLFVFIDEHPDTLLDAQFGNPAGMPFFPVEWFDLPADRHNQGANLSFADGHVERWRWQAPKKFSSFGAPLPPEDQPDFTRVQSAMKLWTDN